MYNLIKFYIVAAPMSCAVAAADCMVLECLLSSGYTTR